MNKQLFIIIGALSLSACGTAQTNQVTSETQTSQTQLYKSLKGDWEGLNKRKKTVLKLVLDKVNTAQKSTEQKDHVSLSGVAYLPLAVEGEGPYIVAGKIETSRAQSVQSAQPMQPMQLSVQLTKSSNVYYKLSCSSEQSAAIWKCELENMPSKQNGMSNKRVSKFSLSKVG